MALSIVRQSLAEEERGVAAVLAVCECLGMSVSKYIFFFKFLSTSEIRVRFLLTVPRQYFFLWIIYVFSVLCLLCLCARLVICALWSSAGKVLTSWLSFVVSNREFGTLPLVS